MPTQLNFERCNWIDVAKGITIILMVLGHSSIPKFLSDFIWAFHMPLFFIASGWCTNWNRDTFGEFIKKRTKSIMLPFVLYSIIVAILYQIIGKHDWIDILQNGWGGYALWFIPLLYLASIITKAVLLIREKFAQILVVVSVVGLAYISGYFRPNLPWTLYSVPYACTFILIGAELKAIYTVKSVDIQNFCLKYRGG